MHGKLEYIAEPLLKEEHSASKGNRTQKRRSSITLTYSPSSNPNKIIFPFDMEELAFTFESFNPSFLNKNTTERDIQKFFSLINDTCNNYETLGSLYSRFKKARNAYISYIVFLLAAGLTTLVLFAMESLPNFALPFFGLLLS